MRRLHLTACAAAVLLLCVLPASAQPLTLLPAGERAPFFAEGVLQPAGVQLHAAGYQAGATARPAGSDRHPAPGILNPPVPFAARPSLSSLLFPQIKDSMPEWFSALQLDVLLEAGVAVEEAMDRAMCIEDEHFSLRMNPLQMRWSFRIKLRPPATLMP